MNQYMSTIESLLFQNFIKYDRLYHITHHAFAGSDANHIRIYIDMPSLLSVLYGTVDQYYTADAYSISASMINLCAHLRFYFASRHRVSAEFYIVYGENLTPTACAVYGEYNAHKALDKQVKTEITRLINQNIDVLATLCPYLPQIYFVNGGAMDSSVVIADLIQYNNAKIGGIVPSIIYTKDTYAYQLVSLLPMTFIYRPKKQYEDCSWVVNKTNIYWAYKTELRSKTVDVPVSISHELLPLVFGMAGLRSRNIPSTFNINSSINRIQRAIDTEVISNNVNGVYGFIDTFKTDLGRQRILEGFNIGEPVYDTIKQKTNAIFLANHLSAFQQSTASELIKNNLVDLYDNNTVREINNTYFQSTPLDLERL